MRSFTASLLGAYSVIQWFCGKIPLVNVLPPKDNRARGQLLMRSRRATGLCGSTESAAGVGLFAFLSRCGTTVQRAVIGPTGFMGLTGFWRDGIALIGVGYSPAKGFQGKAAVFDLALCSQALAPGSRRGKNSGDTGLAFCTLNPPPRSSLLVPIP